MYISKLTKIIPAVVAILTFMGIALHDTTLDSMASFAVALPIVVASYEGASMLLGHEAHTHVERVTADSVSGRYVSQLPKICGSSDKKYRLNRAATKSGHQFEGILTPLRS